METVDRNLYVEDYLTSRDEEAKAVSLVKNNSSLCSRRRFRLTKWISNFPEVLIFISAEDCAKGMQRSLADDSPGKLAF